MVVEVASAVAHKKYSYSAAEKVFHTRLVLFPMLFNQQIFTSLVWRCG